MAGGQSSFNSNSFKQVWRYDVFLSFRGPDVRYDFMGHLNDALRQRGIHTFFDDKNLKGGEYIPRTLLEEIQESKIAIPVFSKNYASSSFCLDELSAIVDCVKAKGSLVIPIFYGVDPTNVRYQKGSYKDALLKHELRFKYDKYKLHKWRMALNEAANCSGKNFKPGKEYEIDFIKNVVDTVSSKINRKPLHVANHPVGLESEAHIMMQLLRVGSNDGVHMVGIHGAPGMGKTTLAREVYNLIADGFEGLCFLENVRAKSINHDGLEHLQETILSKMFGVENLKIGSVSEGIPVIKHRLQGRKVLLVVDDVDKQDQLKAVCGGLDWFRSGSRVIITTQDKKLLANHGVKRTREMNGLGEEEAIELLSWYAFKNKQVDKKYMDMIKRAVTYASRLPLALEVIGSYLFGKSIQDWELALDKYARVLPGEIADVLRVSFDALQEDEQQVFLDLACCFNNFRLPEVENILCAHYGHSQSIAINVLEAKSLIKINDDKVRLLHLIQAMGRTIAQRDRNLGKCTRLWEHKDIVDVLTNNNGTSAIEMILLELPESNKQRIEWDGEAFKAMNNLKTLILRNVHFTTRPKHLPNSLRVLEWRGYPSRSLLRGFCPRNLGILKLYRSRLMSLDLFKFPRMFEDLRALNFDYSQRLTKIPDVSGAESLEELSFRCCENLIEIHKSVGFLKKLKILDASGCSKLRSFPPINLISLKELHLSGCASLENFPEILGKMENIRRLELQDTAIKNLPDSFQKLTQLELLYIHASGMLELPCSIAWLTKLAELVFAGSPSQVQFGEKVSIMLATGKSFRVSQCTPVFFPLLLLNAFRANVEFLELKHHSFISLPEFITKFQYLKKLELDNCHYFKRIRGIPPSLESFSATRCTSLEHFDLTVLPSGVKEYHRLRRLILDQCKNLTEIKGIPPHIEFLSVANCTSLTYSFRNMLLNQELHKEAGIRGLFLPGKRIPEWFEHRKNGNSISFWFCNKFPALSLCVRIGLLDDHHIPFYFCPKLKINDLPVNRWLKMNKGYISAPGLETDHIFIFSDKQIQFDDEVHNLLFPNEWNLAEVYMETYSRLGSMRLSMEIGLHVFNENGRMEDIQFPDIYESNDNNVNFDSNSELSTEIIRPTVVEVRYFRGSLET